MWLITLAVRLVLVGNLSSKPFLAGNGDNKMISDSTVTWISSISAIELLLEVT